MNNIYSQLKNHLDELKLAQVTNHLDEYIDLVNKDKKTMTEALYELFAYEVEAKKIRTMHSCVKVAGFPAIKTFDDFDFSFQPSINKQQMKQFKYLDFVEKKENILFIGTPGVGKTHLAIAIGVEAARLKEINDS